MKTPSANLQKRKPPSRIRYENLNPLFSFRLPKEYHQKLKMYARRKGGSVSGYFKQFIDKNEGLIQSAVKTLGRFYALSPERLEKLAVMCKVNLNEINKARSFNAIGFNYAIEAPHVGAKLNAALCFSYLVLHEVAGLDVRHIASLLGEEAKTIELGISLAHFELLRLFNKILSTRKTLKINNSAMIGDIMSSILWILVKDAECRVLVPPKTLLLGRINIKDPLKFLEGLRMLRKELKESSREIQELRAQLRKLLEEPTNEG